MHDVSYNQALSSFSPVAPVLIAGVLAMPLPAIHQLDMAELAGTSISHTAYHTSNNIATYSHFNSIFRGEYSYATKIFTRPWSTSELEDFLGHSLSVSFEALDQLMSAIRDNYGEVQVDVAIHTDPEEGWTKPVFAVHSGLDNYDEVMDLEDKLFANASKDETLLAILPLVIISQA